MHRIQQNCLRLGRITKPNANIPTQESENNIVPKVSREWYAYVYFGRDVAAFVATRTMKRTSESTYLQINMSESFHLLITRMCILSNMANPQTYIVQPTTV